MSGAILALDLTAGWVALFRSILHLSQLIIQRHRPRDTVMSMAQSECLTYFIIYSLFRRVKPVDIIEDSSVKVRVVFRLIIVLRPGVLVSGLHVPGVRVGGRGGTRDTGLTINKK